MSLKKRFFAQHAKSSALVVSIGIHAVLILVALSFVAVTVINKEEQVFEAKPVNRPKMQLKKLQVPVNVKKKTQKPKLRKRIVVQPKFNQNVPDIKMPEITGVKGGIGAGAGDGLGGSGALGFSMPELKIFGVKSRGEKIFIALDASAYMMYDEIGGIPGYVVIKEELVRILGGLNPTVLFNFAVYDLHNATILFPSMVSANEQNVNKVEEWIKNLNAFKEGMGDREYGLRTLGSGGSRIEKDLTHEPMQRSSQWSQATMLGMQQQADAVFILTQGWGWQHHEQAAAKQWSEAQRAKYEAIKKKAYQAMKEENDRRRKNGEAPQVLVGHSVINKYFPGTPHPPQPERYHYTPKEIIEAFGKMRAENAPKTLATSSGLGKRKSRNKFSINVIHFVRKDKRDDRTEARFKQLTNVGDGTYKTLEGLDEIQSSASSN